MCDLGTYNASEGFVTCIDQDYMPDIFDNDLKYAIARNQVQHQNMQCISCPPCLDCLAVPIRVLPGFSSIPDQRSSFRSSFCNKTLLRCRPETVHEDAQGAGALGEDYQGGHANCLGGDLGSAEVSSCQAAYEGMLCGTCAEGFGRQNENECHACEDVLDPNDLVKTIGGIAGMVFFFGFLLISISLYIGDVYDYDSASSATPTVPTHTNPVFKTDNVTQDDSDGEGDSEKAPSGGKEGGTRTLSKAKLLVTMKRILTSSVAMSIQPVKIFTGYFQVRKTPTWPRSWANFSLYGCIPTGMHGPTCSFWANLTPFSLADCLAHGRYPPHRVPTDDQRALREL
jgi:hypothetical protein